ncbi:MAG TPA: DUF1570 domain-containing protein [Planctomycetota bacterium]
MALAPLLFAALAVLSGGEPEDPPDTVLLVGGKELQGVVLRETSSTLALRFERRDLEIPIEEVRTWSGPRRSRRDYLPRLHAAFRRPPDAGLDRKLAAWCTANGLLRDARVHWWRALLADPRSAAAHRALGHRPQGEEWLLPVEGRGWRSFEEARALHREENRPWGIPSAHFRVRGSGELEDLLAASAELELLYAAYYDRYQLGAGFPELLAPIAVEIHASADSFPRLSGTVDAYYSPATATVHSYFFGGRASQLLHEAMHAIQDRGARQMLRGDPSMPGWLVEGLACYMAASFDDAPGAPRFEAGRPDRMLMRAHAEAVRPASLGRVLRYESGDFAASTRQHEKYGQAYSLVHFLQHGGRPELEAAFLQILAASHLRRSTAQADERLLAGDDAPAFGAAWRAHAAALAED